MNIELEQEVDGRWLAEVPDLPGVMAYGNTQADAVRKTKVLALRLLADRLEHGEELPGVGAVFAISP
jgi:predicted RNase H-like HicB family nuclease